MRSIIFFLSFILVESIASATITNVTLGGGASSFSEDSTAQTLILSGGYTGQSCPQSGSTCDSCSISSSTLAPCNTNMIYPELPVRISFRTNATNLTAASKIAIKTSDGTTVSDSVFAHPTPPLSANSDLYFEMTWGSICQYLLGGDSTCKLAGFRTTSITFGIDINGDATSIEEVRTMTINFSYKDFQTPSTINFCSDPNATVTGQGVCGFSMFPGDEKAYVLTPTLSAEYPVADASGNSWKGFALFYGEAADPNVFYGAGAGKGTAPPKIVAFTGTKDNLVFETDFAKEGISNDRQYCFSLGNQDITGNIYNFINLNDLRNIQNTSQSLCVTPQHVVGLLDNKHCFIATAAFGSEMAEEVQLLRQFRDQFLLKTELGLSFVKFYYNVSPAIASYIANQDLLKYFVRIILWPLILFAKLSMKIGLGFSFLLIALCIGLSVFIFKRYKINKNILSLLFMAICLLNPNKGQSQIHKLRVPNQETNSTPVDSQPQEPPFVNLDQEFESSKPLEAEKKTESIIPEAKNGPEVDGKKEELKVHSESQERNDSGERNYLTEDSAKQRTKKIPHPLSKKGLKAIEADGTYVYRVDVRKSEKTGNFRIALISPPSISTDNSNATFAKLYGDQDLPMFLYDYEWRPFKNVTQLRAQGGFGFFMAQGNGFFENPTAANIGRTPLEKFTFFALPLNLGLIYRFEYKYKQKVVPFMVGGASGYLLGETRDDRSSPHFLVTPTAYGGGGLMLNLSALDRNLQFILDNEYEINNLWLNLEYRYQFSFTDDVDLSTSLVSLGFSVDY